jgi:hypothetical protein
MEWMVDFCISSQVGLRGVSLRGVSLYSFFVRTLEEDVGLGQLNKMETLGVVVKVKGKDGYLKRGMLPHFDVQLCPFVNIFLLMIWRFGIREEPGVLEQGDNHAMNVKMLRKKKGSPTEEISYEEHKGKWERILELAGFPKTGKKTHLFVTRSLFAPF